MEKPRLSKSVRRVVKLDRDGTGALVPTVLYRSETRKKKGSRSMRPLEKVVRRLADAQARASNLYVSRHMRANQKRKDGWLKDLVPNVTRAEQKGRKSLTKNGIRMIRPI